MTTPSHDPIALRFDIARRALDRFNARIAELDETIDPARDDDPIRDTLLHLDSPIDAELDYDCTIDPILHETANIIRNATITPYRERLTEIALIASLCPMHFCDYAICFDDDDPECASIRLIHPNHDT
jgi:hypothetical protein